MSRELSSTALAAALAQETGQVFVVLIEIDHDELDAPIRVCSDSQAVTHGGDSYAAYPFDLTLPTDKADGVTRARLSIDNIEREIVQAVRSIATPPSCTITIVLADSPDTVEAEFSGFEFTNISYDAYTVSGDITIESFMNESYPAGSFLPSKFPGLF